MMKNILFLFIFLQIPIDAFGHELHETSATLTIRDQTAEIRINVDLLQWLERQKPKGASHENIEPTQYMALLIFSEKSLENATLVVDGKTVTLRLIQFPVIQDVVAALKAKDQGRHFRTSVTLLAALPKLEVKKIKLKLPEELGDSVISLVRPTTRYVHSGSSASFQLN